MRRPYKTIHWHTKSLSLNVQNQETLRIYAAGAQLTQTGGVCLKMHLRASTRSYEWPSDPRMQCSSLFPRWAVFRRQRSLPPADTLRSEAIFNPTDTVMTQLFKTQTSG